MATVLDKELKRRITVDGVDYTVALDPGGIRVLGKGKRLPEVELRWSDLLSGEAAIAIALHASLTESNRPARVRPAAKQPGDQTTKPRAKTRPR